LGDLIIIRNGAKTISLPSLGDLIINNNNNNNNNNKKRSKNNKYPKLCLGDLITPYFWKWWVFVYFLCTVVLSTSEKIAYMYTFKIMFDTSVIQ
jgi:hypothetical protein